MVFLTKKRQREMRERRRKLKRRHEDEVDEVDDAVDDETDAVVEQGASSDTHHSTAPQQQQRQDDDNNADTVLIDGKLVVRLPDDENKNLKKFRKETRRKARKRGIADVVFLEEHEPLPVPTHPEPRPKKKTATTTTTFYHARINDVLAADRERRLQEKEERQRRKAELKIQPEERDRYVGLDCEMVGVGPNGRQSALARVSVVGFDDGVVLLDTFVRVPDRVTDFRTSVSGVRAKDIKSKAMDLSACRSAVGKLLLHKVLVGHALSNDLQVLSMDHPKKDVRDTAKWPEFMRTTGRNGGKLRPRRLKDLTKERLDRDIQRDGEAHSSVDDARAAMDLYKCVRSRWEKELSSSSSGTGSKGGR